MFWRVTGPRRYQRRLGSGGRHHRHVGGSGVPGGEHRRRRLAADRADRRRLRPGDAGRIGKPGAGPGRRAAGTVARNARAAADRDTSGWGAVRGALWRRCPGARGRRTGHGARPAGRQRARHRRDLRQRERPARRPGGDRPGAGLAGHGRRTPADRGRHARGRSGPGRPWPARPAGERQPAGRRARQSPSIWWRTHHRRPWEADPCP